MQHNYIYVLVVLINIVNYMQYNYGSDYSIKNFQVKENKMRMRNIHSRFFHLLF